MGQHCFGAWRHKLHGEFIRSSDFSAPIRTHIGSIIPVSGDFLVITCPCHNLPAPWNIYAYFYYLLLGVSFWVYIKDWKNGNGRNEWSPQRVHFSDWFFQKIILDNANSQMYQSHKTLRPAQRNEPPTDVHTTIPGQPSVLPLKLRGPDSAAACCSCWALFGILYNVIQLWAHL